MQFKGLILKFGFGSLEALCKRKGWRVPLVSEIRNNPTACEHRCFWVADEPEKIEDRKTHAYLYCVDSKELILVNKNHMKHAVVIVEKGKL